MTVQAAAEALASLAKCESRRSTIVIQGAVMPLALALRSNPVPETLTAICSSLASLAAVPEGREAMGLGVPSLVNVLRLDIPEALKDAVEALLLLARHSPTYRSSIRNNGGMRYLRNVLRSGPPSLHPKVCPKLYCLCSVLHATYERHKRERHVACTFEAEWVGLGEYQGTIWDTIRDCQGFIRGQLGIVRELLWDYLYGVVMDYDFSFSWMLSYAGDGVAGSTLLLSPAMGAGGDSKREQRDSSMTDKSFTAKRVFADSTVLYCMRLWMLEADLSS